MGKYSNVNPELVEQVHMMYRNIKYLREKNGLTQKELAAILEISEAKVKRMEAFDEVGLLYVHHIIALCEYFKVSYKDFMETKLYE